MVGYHTQGVPGNVDLETNGHQKKYTVNRPSDKGLVISRPLCALMAIGALLLALLIGLIVFFLAPRYCNGVEAGPLPLEQNNGDRGPPPSPVNNSDGSLPPSPVNNSDGSLPPSPVNNSDGSLPPSPVNNSDGSLPPSPVNNSDGSLPPSPVNNSDGILPLSLAHNSDRGPPPLPVEVNERLPRNVEPIHYRLQIIPNIEDQTTSGAVVITLLPHEDTDTIIFNINNITIHQHSLSVKSISRNSGSFDIREQDYLEGQRYKIVLRKSLTKDEEYFLSIQFTGELNSHLQGFYRSQYSGPNGEIRYAASTQFSPTDARRAFPCFDEPSFKSIFTITLARPVNMTTLSNMPLKKSEIMVEQPGWYWDHYPETPRMSTYLVAFLISDLKDIQSSNRAIKIWTREALLTQARYAGQIAPNILAYFEEYFNISFPLPKIDIVAVPEFGFSAMENWGLITFRESSLLLDTDSSVIDQRTIATVLSHEIAHQWFGNLVTPKWWNDLWLKEGFATYLEYLGVAHAEPTWNIVEEFMASETERAMSIDALESSRPISFEVINSRQIKQAFDEISYAKGACIIRMMNHFLGEETFKRGLVRFLEKYRNGNADRQDLFNVLTEEAHWSNALLHNETVSHIMDTWTEQAGFPVLTAVANYENGTVTIRQNRFLYTGIAKQTSKWWVPISFTSEASPDFVDTKPDFWLRGEPEITETVQFGKWYLLNINQTGYYIVNYDEQNWKALRENIMYLPPLIRAQLVSDSMDLARANQLDYEVPLRLIAKMAVNDGEIMFVPTLIAFEKLKFLSDILSATPAFGLFEEYHKTIFKRHYEVVTLDDNIDHYLTKRIRIIVLEWSCRSPESRCVHQSRSKFRSWMTNDVIIEPNLRDVVYCTAIREGGELEWDFAYQKYLDTSSPTEKNRLLDALGCTKLKWLLSRYIDLLIDENSSIRIQDADRVFESVAQNKFGTQIAFDFLRKNWSDLLHRFGDGFNILGKMIKSLASQMNTEYQLSELERFKDSLKTNISTTTTAFDSAIETVRSNVQWMQKNYDSVEHWLKKYREHYSYL